MTFLKRTNDGSKNLNRGHASRPRFVVYIDRGAGDAREALTVCYQLTDRGWIAF